MHAAPPSLKLSIVQICKILLVLKQVELASSHEEKNPRYLEKKNPQSILNWGLTV